MSNSIIEKQIIELLLKDAKPIGVVGSPSDSFEVTIDIREVSAEDKLLGEMVCFLVKEGGKNVLVLGQITEIKTENKWHEEPSFKSVIKRHGSLPHLSGVADNRIATITVQSSFTLGKNEADFPEAHKLANSPSTGQPVKRITNDLMRLLMKEYGKNLVCLGKAYDTDVCVPFWFKHFGNPKEGGAGDAYHIGVFGRTGSGKTVTAANMILGYARNKEKISILILDPQEQFYCDNNVIPGKSFKSIIEDEIGCSYEKYIVPDQIHLPSDPYIFSELIFNSGFIRKAFRIMTEEKGELMRDVIDRYMRGRLNEGNIFERYTGGQFLTEMIQRFAQKDQEEDERCSVYIADIYAAGTGGARGSLVRVMDRLASGGVGAELEAIWTNIWSLFQSNNGSKKSIESIIDDIISNNNKIVILNVAGRSSQFNFSENLQALFIKVIQERIMQKGQDLYTRGEQANCLVVMDEAHRFVSVDSSDPRIVELSKNIIDAVRTTRKYGIGYMFITQTLESLHAEIRRQMRVFAFGYGLTSGSEFAKIRDIINDDAATKFYKSFIDPTSNGKYPFMFYGPVSPLSFTGSPLFLEMDEELTIFNPETGS